MLTTTKYQSIRYMDGVWYGTDGYNIVFVPLDDFDVLKFRKLVEQAEEQEGRRLNLLELDEIAQELR